MHTEDSANGSHAVAGKTDRCMLCAGDGRDPHERPAAQRPAGLGSTLLALCPVSWLVRWDSTGACPVELCQVREFTLGRAGDRASRMARARKGLWAL